MSYATAKIQREFTVLGFCLRPFSIGHLLLLESCNSAFVSQQLQEITRPQLLSAVIICSRKYSESIALRNDPFAGIRMLYWRWRSRKCDLQAEIEAFYDYLAEGNQMPVFKSEGGRPCGAPLSLRLIQFLRGTGMTEQQSLDCPIASATWEWGAYWEDKGAIKIQNAEEVEFEAWCAEQDRIESQEKEAANGD